MLPRQRGSRRQGLSPRLRAASIVVGPCGRGAGPAAAQLSRGPSCTKSLCRAAAPQRRRAAAEVARRVRRERPAPSVGAQRPGLAGLWQRNLRLGRWAPAPAHAPVEALRSRSGGRASGVVDCPGASARSSDAAPASPSPPRAGAAVRRARGGRAACVPATTPARRR